MLKTFIMLLFITNILYGDVNLNYFDFIKHNLKIEVKDTKIENNNDNTFNITSNIDWSLKNSTKFIKELQHSINIIPENKKDLYGISHYSNNPKYYTITNDKNQTLFKNLASKQVVIRIRYGKYVNYIPISTARTKDNTEYGNYKIILLVKKYDFNYLNLPIKFTNLPNKLLQQNLKIQTDVIIDKPFYNLIARNTDAKNYNYDLFKNNNIKYELEEFEWRVSKIEVNTGNLHEKLKKRKKILNDFIKKINLHKNNWINVKLQKLNQEYNNTKNNRDNIFKRANNISNNYISRLRKITNKVVIRTNQENKLFVEKNYLIHYTMAYR